MHSLPDAVKELIRRNKRPLITWFEIEGFVRRLYRERVFDGERLLIKSSFPSARSLSALRTTLLDPTYGDDRLRGSESWEDQLERRAATEGERLLIADRDFSSSVWRVAGIPDESPEALCCAIDPWCYVSHLSAMQQWGLTNRNPRALQLTRPSKLLWRQRAKDEAKEACGQLEPGDPGQQPRERVTFPPVLRKRDLAVFEPGYFGRSVDIPDSHARIATVGQTFRDMLHEPALCGGMSHVLEVWDDHAATYLDEIIEALNAPELKTTKIAFVRAGYILSERLQVQDARVDAWAQFAERGGSRKLDPEKPFEPQFSERWMLSLNVS